MKNQKGITLIALVVTIIVILIIAGISITSAVGVKGNVKTARSNITMAELSQIQQVVLETYIKYKQTNNLNILVGTKIEYTEAETYLKKIDASLNLKQNEENTEPNDYYYKIEKADLEKLGIKNSDEDESYIINYSTGEVFSATEQFTAEGDVLYIYATEQN